ncbi:MAG: ATP-binding protein [Acidobacteriia bacterium]|nr:ATP-binding protein [Terriglobia bacterium]
MTIKNRSARQSGKLRIGDDWNAITIIALLQQNPLKAVAELVENSIDAGAANIAITRGKEHSQHYLRIADDGAGVPRTDGCAISHVDARHTHRFVVR